MIFIFICWAVIAVVTQPIIWFLFARGYIDDREKENLQFVSFFTPLGIILIVGYGFIKLYSFIENKAINFMKKN